MFESHLNHITFESYLNHESSQERRRRSWNAEWQKNRLFAYCQQHIFWLIGLAFLHIHSTVFFTHITNFLDQLKRASRAERLVQCQRSKLPIAVDFCTQSCPSFWKNCKKNLTRTRKNLVFEENLVKGGQSQRIMEFHICKKRVAILTKTRFLLPAVTDMFQGKKFSAWHRPRKRVKRIGRLGPRGVSFLKRY